MHPDSENRFKDSLSLSVIVPVYNERHLVASSVARVLSLKSRRISDLEVILVDDGSTDGSREVLEKLVLTDGRMKLLRHETKQGKGAAIRTGLKYVTKDVCIIHDADMEYNPNDIPSLMLPFLEEGADAVYGARYLSSTYRRALMFRHSLMNKLVTLVVNVFTDIDLADVETCYKAVKTSILKSIPLRYNDFRFEVEVTMKLAKRKVRIFEAPIRYLSRSREEGKKIHLVDGLLAVLAILKLSLVEDLYPKEAYGLKILSDMNLARRFNKWMADTLRPYVGDRVLEIGAGLATLTNQFIPRELYVASDINDQALEYLRS